MAFEGIRSLFGLKDRAIAAVMDGPYFVKPARYGYSNARVSAMKSLIISKETLSELARLDSMESMVEMLERTHYKEPLVKLSTRHSGQRLVQMASAVHFASIAEKCARVVPKGDRAALHALMAKWDLTNLRMIIRGAALQKDFEGIMERMMPYGEFADRETAKKIFDAKGPAQFSALLKTRTGSMFIHSGVAPATVIEKLFITQGAQDLATLEAYLDHCEYRTLLNAGFFFRPDLAAVSRVFAREIDLRNASVAVRLKSHNVASAKNMDRYFLAGGTLGKGVFMEALEATDAKSTLASLAKKLKMKNAPTGTAEMEEAFEKDLGTRKVKAFYRSTLSIGAILGLLLLKEEEFKNLRKIAVGKTFQLPYEKVMEMLVTA
jgi:vacuolar-type H+-ATPase subunit C/Vma6